MPLTITVPAKEYYVEKLNQFRYEKERTLTIEHSLISIKKWEQKYHRSFFNDKDKKTSEEMMDYVRCMALGTVDPMTYVMLTRENIQEISDYINDPMTATTFKDIKLEGESGNSKRNKIITSEIVYYWMTQLNIPPEYAKWHINQLITLIRVSNEEQKKLNGGGKKIPKKGLTNRNAAINAANRKRFNSKG